MKKINKLQKGRKTSVKKALARGWNNIRVNAPVLPAITGSTNLLGTNTYNSTVGDELKVAQAGAASLALPAAGKLSLEAMNTLFTPSTWLNPVTGSKLLSPMLGTIADAGVQGYFTYQGLDNLKNQAQQGTLLSDPGNTLLNTLQIFPLIAPAAKVVGDVAQQGVGPYVFQHLPYQQIDNTKRFFRRMVNFLRTPITENPIKGMYTYNAKRAKALQRPVKIESANNYETQVGNDLDIFKQRLEFYDKNHITKYNTKPETLTEAVDKIPVVNYMSLKMAREVVDEAIPKATRLQKNLATLWAYFKINSGAGTAVLYDKAPYVFLNPKALRDYKLTTDVSLPHEFAHLFSHYYGSLPDWYNTPGVYSEILPKGQLKYLRGDELLARGTQLKNYFGIVDDTPITGDMLKYAAKHYVEDTGADNNMLQFFHTITDWDAAADHLSRYSYKSGGVIKR